MSTTNISFNPDDVTPSGDVITSDDVIALRRNDPAVLDLHAYNHHVTYTWKDITVTARVKGGCLGREIETKNILRGVNGIGKPGELMAIMEGSGAGKSTLLNALAFRNLSGLDVTGQRFVNGKEVKNTLSTTTQSAYVQQDDLFVGTLTVREHLIHQAKLRMDRHLTLKQKMDRVDQVMAEMGLTECADELIGGKGRTKGISRGEAKRLALAEELLTNPALMFCDEPTSGMDSFTAQNVVQTLRQLAYHGKTVICTMHQPSSQVFALFDKILLLAEGRLAFLGTRTDAKAFFAECNHPLPVPFNPADFYIKTLSVDPCNEDPCKQIEFLCDEFKESEFGRDLLEEIDSTVKEAERQRDNGASKDVSPYRVGCMAQFPAVLQRAWLAMIKESNDE